jgi:DNA-binding NarL/FixJ family response regulator
MIYERDKRVFLVDDHQVVLEGLKLVVNQKTGFEVVGCALDWVQAMEVMESAAPDIAVTDISMPGMDGTEAILEIRERFPHVQIIVFTMFSDPEHVLSLYKLGISAYVLKEQPVSELIFALETVSEGGVFFSTVVQEVLRDRIRFMDASGGQENHQVSDLIGKLSRREREIFPLLADGVEIKAIADRLCISPKTVESHKYNILNKLHLGCVSDLTKLAIKEGFITV